MYSEYNQNVKSGAHCGAQLVHFLHRRCSEPMKYVSANLRKNKKSYRAILRYYDSDGNRKQKTKTLKATSKVQAQRELEEWRQEEEKLAQKASLLHEEQNQFPTVDEMLSSYIDILDRTRSVERVTIKGYKASQRLWSPLIGDIPINELTQNMIEKAEIKLYETGKANATISKAHVLLKSVLERRVEADELKKNPMRYIKAPRRENKARGINALDKEARTKLLDALDKMPLERIQLAAYIALYTGMRRGEICGLRWKDVNLENNTINVAQSIGVASGDTYVKNTKTNRTRCIVIPNKLVAILEKWQSLGHKAEYVIEGRDTTPWTSPDIITKQWTILAHMLDLVGIEERTCSFHDLRHTWATAAVAAGIDIKTVSSNLGHSNAAMTLNIYASADPDAKRAAAEKMNDVI